MSDCHGQGARLVCSPALMAVDAAAFILTEGHQWLGSYPFPSGHRRYFCRQCGSQVYIRHERENQCILYLGSSDTGPVNDFFCHITPTLQRACSLFPAQQVLSKNTGEMVIPSGLDRCYGQMREVLLKASRQETATSLLLLEAGAMKAVILERDIRKNIRLSDHLESLPGSRFAILLPYTGAGAARILGERIRNSARIDAFENSLVIGSATRLPEPLAEAGVMTVIDTMFTAAERSMAQR